MTDQTWKQWALALPSIPLGIFARSWTATVASPKILVKAIRKWREPKPKERIVVFPRSPRHRPPISTLPLKKERRLSIDALSSPPSLLGRLMPGGTTQTTHAQKKSLLLTKLPPEIRNLIYAYILGDRVIHIIPSLVPSRTKPAKVTPEQPFLSRLDYEFCRHADQHDGLLGISPHSTCAIWITHDGELYFNAPKAVVQSVDELETRYLRWWCRKDRALSMLKTCRQIYTEAIYILYATNTFDFRSINTFAQFPSTILPKRLNTIRTLHIRVKPTNSHIENPFLTSSHALKAWRALKQFRGLTSVVLLVEGDRNDAEKILVMMDSVTGPRNYPVKAKWTEIDSIEGQVVKEIVKPAVGGVEASE